MGGGEGEGGVGDKGAVSFDERQKRICKPMALELLELRWNLVLAGMVMASPSERTYLQGGGEGRSYWGGTAVNVLAGTSGAHVGAALVRNRAHSVHVASFWRTSM